MSQDLKPSLKCPNGSVLSLRYFGLLSSNSHPSVKCDGYGDVENISDGFILKSRLYGARNNEYCIIVFALSGKKLLVKDIFGDDL